MVSSLLTDRNYRPSLHGFSLRPAADALDAAFADELVHRRVEHCTHCVSDADLAAMNNPHEVTPEVMSRFVRKVGTTWGNAADLRRATPRMLQLAADHQLNVSRVLVWQKLRWARWQEWSPEQTEAINQFLQAEFTRLLRNPPRPAHAAHRWLGQVTAGIDDLTDLLTVWNDSIGPLPDPSVQATAVAHLVELLTTSPLRPDLPTTIADVFPHNPDVAPQLTAFLIGPGTDLDLRRAATERAGTSSSRRLNVAIERLRRFRAGVEREHPHHDPE